MHKSTSSTFRIHLCILSLFFMCCGTTSPGFSNTCPQSVENEKGVGHPCSTHEDCANLAADYCPAAELSNDFDFCTRPCNPFLMDGDLLSCGPGAHCTDHGWGPALCAPTECSASLVSPPIYPEAAIPCAVEEAVNEVGVGKPCEVHADCAGLPAGKCPMDIHPGLPTWCSVLCDANSDCGTDAFCWVRPSVDGGIVGSCAPIECRIYPEVDIECNSTSVNILGIGQPCETESICENLVANTCGTKVADFKNSFCTKKCIYDEDCGSNAFCWNDLSTQSSACIPILCIH